jgi:hypothetical protein
MIAEFTEKIDSPSRYKVRIYPSGDFTVGNNSAFGPQIDRDHDPSDRADHDPSKLGLSDASNSRKSHPNPTPKRGLHGITPENKRYVKSAVALLDAKWGRKCATFGTATLPQLSDKDLEKVCDGWGKIVNRFLEKLSRLLEDRGLDKDYLYVTEIQEQRWQRTGKVNPHIHWLAQGRKSPKENWYIRPEEIKQIWQKTLENFLDKKIDSRSSTRIECPRKSLVCEMGKYLSKGGKLIKDIIKAGQGYLLPSAYCGMSRALKRYVKQDIAIYTSDIATWFARNLSRLESEGKVKFRKILIQYGGKEICVGSSGWLRGIDLESVLIEYFKEREENYV